MSIFRKWYKLFIFCGGVVLIFFMMFFLYQRDFQEKKIGQLQFPKEKEMPSENIIRPGVILPKIEFIKKNNQTVRVRKISLKGEDGRCSVNTIVVNPKDEVEISFAAIDNAYVFSIPDLKIEQRINRGEKTVFGFKTKNVGNLNFYCKDPNSDREYKGTIVIAEDCEGCG